MTTTLQITRPARKRSDYATRTGQNTRSAAINAAAANEKPVFIEDCHGNLIRKWSAEDQKSYRSADYACALRRTRAVELHDLLAVIPLSAVKYALGKGWIVRDQNPLAQWFWVTKDAKAELNLPKIDSMGQTIKFSTRIERPELPQIDRILAPMIRDLPAGATA